MNRRRPWTEKEQQDLLQWTANGISLERIAVRLNRTVMAVQNRLYALKGKAEANQQQPVRERPAQEQPVQEQAVQGQPVQDQPVHGQPDQTQPDQGRSDPMAE